MLPAYLALVPLALALIGSIWGVWKFHHPDVRPVPRHAWHRWETNALPPARSLSDPYHAPWCYGVHYGDGVCTKPEPDTNVDTGHQDSGKTIDVDPESTPEPVADAKPVQSEPVPHIGATEELGMIGYVAPVARPSARNLTATPPTAPTRRVPRTYVHRTPRTISVVCTRPTEWANTARFLLDVEELLARWAQEGMATV